MVGPPSDEYRPRRARVPAPGEDHETLDRFESDGGEEDSGGVTRVPPRRGRPSQSDATPAGARVTALAPRRSLVTEANPSDEPDQPERGHTQTLAPSAPVWPAATRPDTIDSYGQTAEPIWVGNADGEDEPVRRRRPRLVLLLGGVAALVAVALAVVYSVIALRGSPAASPDARASSTVPGGSEGGGSAAGAEILLTDSRMLGADGARQLDPSRAWTVALTQKGVDANAPEPLCLSAGQPQGTPAPSQLFLRTLVASGTNPPAALHEALAYVTPADATTAFALASGELGSCPTPSSWITSGASVTGLGDQAVALGVSVLDGNTVRNHSLVLSRTGRVLNLLDVATPSGSASLSTLANVLGTVTNAQCKPAAGSCASNTQVTTGPPPAGGDQPGFLATADIPQIRSAPGAWTGTVPGSPQVVTSQCENVDFTTVAGPKQRQARTYLLDNPGRPSLFGLDEVILTMGSTDGARKFVQTIEHNLATCKDRTLTAGVSPSTPVSDVGAKGTAISGSTVTVTQKVTATNSATYRVGVSAAGSKVIYTFLPASGKFDFSASDWTALNVRAAQRATQAP